MVRKEVSLRERKRRVLETERLDWSTETGWSTMSKCNARNHCN